MAAVTYQANFDAAQVNNLRIDVISFSAEELANQLLPFIEQGSKISSLTRDDLNVYKVAYGKSSSISVDERIDEDSDIAALLSVGQNKFFDVLFWLSLPKDERPAMREITENQVAEAIPIGEICSALFVQYFFILTRGRVSEATTSNLGTDLPKFIHTVMNLRDSPKDYSDRLASFSLHKLGYEWVRYVPFGKISREAVSRFGLGVAGYRLLAPFRLLTPRRDLEQNLLDAVEVARSMATQPASWDIHPSTRHNDILNEYGPLNANLSNLMLEVFDHGDLRTLVEQKALFKFPVHDPTATNYRTWSDLYVTDGRARIFP